MRCPSGTDHDSLQDSTTPRLQRGPSNGRMACRTAEIHSTANKEHIIVPKTVPGACHKGSVAQRKGGSFVEAPQSKRGNSPHVNHVKSNNGKSAVIADQDLRTTPLHRTKDPTSRSTVLPCTQLLVPIPKCCVPAPAKCVHHTDKKGSMLLHHM